MVRAVCHSLAGAAALAAVLCVGGCESGSSPAAAGPGGATAAGGQAPVGAGDGTLKVVSALPPPSNTNNGADQLISPSDTLEFSVFQVADLTRTVQVDSAGNVNLPLVGTQKAAGMSVRALEASLERQYGAKYLQAPDVTVFMKDSVGQRVTVDGEVAKAGIYPVNAGTSLLQVLALAGGFRPVADTSKIYVFRQVDSKQLVANVDVDKVRKGSTPDPKIYGGDKIVVFSSGARVAFQNLKEALGVASGARPFAMGM